MPLENNIEIRSEEVQEIMGHIPNWIIRWGITLIFAVLFVLLIGTWVFKYPDVINSPVIITSENPPADIVAKVNGRIEELLITDNQNVAKNKILAIIENPALYSDVKIVISKLDSLSETSIKNNHTINFKANYKLGYIQSYYARFLNTYDNFKHFKNLNYHQKKINSIKNQVEITKVYYKQVKAQQDIIAEELVLSENEYKRAKLLYEQDVISTSDYEIKQSSFLQNKYALEGAKSNLSNTKIQLANLEQAILDLEMNLQEQTKQHQLSLTEALNNLKAQISIWEQNYLLKSPFEGKVTFNKFWSKNQNVLTGNTIFTIIPLKTSGIIGKITLPLEGSGKVKIGQKVNIKFLGYPHMEYGMVKGIINTISIVPDGGSYMVEINLPEGMITNYGKQLPFSQKMTGNAEIITDNLRIIERLLNPIKSLIKRNRGL